MKQKLAKLLCVKSIVTIILTLIFAYLCINGTITANEMITIYATIIAFYFGTQAIKDKTNDGVK